MNGATGNHPVMDVNQNLPDYYARRAHEYESIYHKPERQQDLARLKVLLPQLLAGRRVLEIACGTGYWTGLIAARAAAVVATDINQVVLDIARAKDYPCDNVTFRRTDAYAPALPQPAAVFDAGFAGFWWSHVARERLGEFLRCFHRQLAAQARVVFLDNAFVAGSSTPLARYDANGNSYQLRSLNDGSQHEVLKNFPDEQELKTLLQPLAHDIRYQRLPYYWLVSYQLSD
jgi:demethylmenaquinone methyltransferase/2-methoxy-6-polyprenyl-1,4-benzoquinol methylase